MRLINTSSLRLETFYGDQIPLYAILSHTWGKDELLFDDFHDGIGHVELASPKRGLQKVLKTCEQAKKDSFGYAWVDTCCIDKSSSAELSEAINSMFRWYEDSATCYIYLEDVVKKSDGMDVTDITASKWFTRGWTLQELIAPHGATFFDANWKVLASRAEIATHVADKTGIDKTLLERRHKSIGKLTDAAETSQQLSTARCRSCGALRSLQLMLQQYGVAARMRWAAHRRTTREEDIAYCLLGLFGISMPLLYGEGTEAFRRLQEEVLKRYPADQSTIAWIDERSPNHEVNGLLAKSPSAFCLEGVTLAKQLPWRGDIKIAPTPRGVELDVWLIAPYAAALVSNETDWDGLSQGLSIAVLDCFVNGQMIPRLGIFVRHLQGNMFHRARTSHMALLNASNKSRLLRREGKYVGDTSRSVSMTIFRHFEVNFDLKAAAAKRITLVDYSGVPGIPWFDGKSISDQSPLVVNIQDTTSFTLMASSPPLIKTPTGSMVFGSPLPRDPGAMNLEHVYLTGVLYFSQAKSDGFFVVCGRKFTGLTDSHTGHMCTFLSWQEFQDRSVHPDLRSFWRNDFQSKGSSPSRNSSISSGEVQLTRRKSSIPMAPEAISKEFRLRVNVRRVGFLGRESSELFVQSLGPH